MGAVCTTSRLQDCSRRSDQPVRQDELMVSWFRLYGHVCNINKCVVLPVEKRKTPPGSGSVCGSVCVCAVKVEVWRILVALISVSRQKDDYSCCCCVCLCVSAGVYLRVRQSDACVNTGPQQPWVL